MQDGIKWERPFPSERPSKGAPEVINHFIAARDKQGNVADHKKAIRKIIKDNLGKPIIGNLVFGSKSGIMDDLNIIDEFPDGVMWVVDMCQFRADRQLIHELITKGVMLMVTGSKFFQAPPFCGALLVPKTITSALSSLDASPAAVFGKLFTKYDFPHSLTGIREQLPDFQKLGIAHALANCHQGNGSLHGHSRICNQRLDPTMESRGSWPFSHE